MGFLKKLFGGSGKSPASDRLLLAAGANDAAAVQQLLQMGEKVDAATKDGVTPLILASEFGHAKVVKLLLAGRANVNAADKYGETPLIKACANFPVENVTLGVGDTDADVIKLLVAARANVNAATKNGDTPLIFACSKGRTDAVKVLVAAGANVNAANKNGDTPLILACKFMDYEHSRGGHADLVKLLVAAGANVDAANKDGKTPFSYAFHYGNTDVLLTFLSGMAKEPTAVFEIHDAARDGDLAKVKALLQGNPDLVYSKDSNGRTPLHCAALAGQKDIAELLLVNKADVVVTDSNGWTPLALAVNGGNNDVLKLLFDALVPKSTS